MKILLLSNTNNVENGYGNLTHELCRHLEMSGIEFTLLLPAEEPRYSYVTYRTEHVLPPYIFDLKTKKILKYLAFSYATDADIVHSITEFPYAVLAARIAKKNKKPLIIESAGTYGVKPLLQFPDKFFLSWAYSKAKLIIPISAFTGEMIKKLSRTRTPMKIIHPGVDFKRFDQAVDVRDIQNKYGNKKILLTVGVLKPRKGHDVVLKALAELRKERDDFHYVIVGSFNEGRDAYYKSLQKIVEESNLGNNVTFAGSVDDGELVKYFQAAYLYIHTPRVINMNFEGFGIVYLEAGAARKPVIAADSGGVKDAVTDGKTGIIVPENDSAGTAGALRKLLDDPVLVQKMGEAGHEAARVHDWKIIVKEYISAYKELLS